MQKATIAAAGFEEMDSFGGLSLHVRESGGARTILVFDGAEARAAEFGAATAWRDVLRDESEARMLRTVAAGMAPGAGRDAALAHADSVAPLGAVWTG